MKETSYSTNLLMATLFGDIVRVLRINLLCLIACLLT